MDRIPILYVKGEEAVAEDLRLVVSLDPQSLSRMERSKTLLQFAQNIFVHPVTLSWRRPQSSLTKPDADRHLQLIPLIPGANRLGKRCITSAAAFPWASIGPATDRPRVGRPKTEAEVARCRSLPEEQILYERGSAQD